MKVGNSITQMQPLSALVWVTVYGAESAVLVEISGANFIGNICPWLSCHECDLVRLHSLISLASGCWFSQVVVVYSILFFSLPGSWISDHPFQIASASS